MKLLSKLSILLILFSLMACSTEPSMKRIKELKGRVEKAENKIEDVERQFDELVEEYSRVDSILRNNNTPKKEMLLLGAYLQQYENVRDEMKNDINYSYSQLNNLKDDIKEGLYDENQRTEFLDMEEKVIKQVEARLDYFSKRFGEQEEFVKSVQ